MNDSGGLKLAMLGGTLGMLGMLGGKSPVFDEAALIAPGRGGTTPFLPFAKRIESRMPGFRNFVFGNSKSGTAFGAATGTISGTACCE